jgi:hypothetical protein
VDNVINMPEQSIFWTMNMLKKSIAHMLKRNTEGQYDEAIYKEQLILRSFFDRALERSTEAQPEAVAA